MSDQDYIDLGFDEVEVYHSGGQYKLCRACEQDLHSGDRVRVRKTDDETLNGLHHEACADEIVREYQEDK